MNALLRRLFTAEIIAGLRLSALGRWWADRAARRLEKVSRRKSADPASTLREGG